MIANTQLITTVVYLQANPMSRNATVGKVGPKLTWTVDQQPFIFVIYPVPLKKRGSGGIDYHFWWSKSDALAFISPYWE